MIEAEVPNEAYRSERIYISRTVGQKSIPPVAPTPHRTKMPLLHSHPLLTQRQRSMPKSRLWISYHQAARAQLNNFHSCSFFAYF